MTARTSLRLGMAAVAAGCLAGSLCAQAPSASRAARPDRGSLKEPVYRVAQELANKPVNDDRKPAADHPLMPALKMARDAKAIIDSSITDYTATLNKREQINGVVGERETMFVKIRHQPFSVYIYFLSPSNIKGREVIYVEGKNNGNIVAHDVGLKGLITVRLDPKGALAMQGQRYPITEIGFSNLASRLIEVAEADSHFGECEVKFYNNATINKRPCTGIEVIHPTPRKNFRFHRAIVFVDKEMNIPVHYASYDWPSRPGAKPELLEEYTYSDVKLNVGLTDADFDENNKEYHFH